MKNVNFAGFTRSYATLTGDILAIFSRQPVTVYLDIRDALGTRCRVTVSRGSQSIAEEREAVRVDGTTFLNSAEFEVSRMLQLVTDADSVLKRITYDGEPHSLADYVQIRFESFSLGAWRSLGSATVEAIPAAVDWGEVVNSQRTRRRIWANYPQTISCGHDGSEEIYITGDTDNTIYLQDPTTRTGYELDAMEALAGFSDGLEVEIANGATAPVFLSYQTIIANGQGTLQAAEKAYLCEGQTDPTGKGVYLRWLHRDGTAGYWLFGKSKEAASVSASQSFTRPVSGVPAQPYGGVIQNPARQSFDVSEVITIGAANITDDEYRYLLGLVSSPVVEMLCGGTRTAPEWVRVTVAPASYTREIPKSELGRLRDFELQIIPPQRNALKI